MYTLKKKKKKKDNSPDLEESRPSYQGYMTGL